MELRADKEGRPLMRVITLLLLLVAGAAISPMLAGPFVSLLDKVLTSSSGAYGVLVLVLVGLLLPVWFILLLKESYLYALGLQMLMLPFTFRAANGLAIPAYDDGTFVQKISLTTFLIVGLLVWLRLANVSVRRRPELKGFEALLLAFAILSTISQLANHTLGDALLLSIGGAWQFVALFYIFCAVIRDPEDVKFILGCLVVAFLIGVFDRMASTGAGFMVEAPSNLAKIAPHAVAGDFVRVGSGAFGFAQSYGGYLSFVSVLGLYFVQSARSRLRQVVWAIVVLVLSFEMLNTFTRGATLAFLFVFLLLLWKDSRPFFTKILVATAIVVFTWLGEFLINLATVRTLELNPSFLLSDPNSTSRLDLYYQSLPHFFDNWGLGYGIGKPLFFYTAGVGEAVSHNTTLDLSQSVGGLATVLFLIMFFVAAVRLFRMSRNPAAEKDARLAIYIFIGLLAWFFFANTTSTSLVYYYPYEATIVFYSVMFLGVLVTTMTNVRSVLAVTAASTARGLVSWGKKYA